MLACLKRRLVNHDHCLPRTPKVICHAANQPSNGSRLPFLRHFSTPSPTFQSKGVEPPIPHTCKRMPHRIADHALSKPANVLSCMSWSTSESRSRRWVGVLDVHRRCSAEVYSETNNRQTRVCSLAAGCSYGHTWAQLHQAALIENSPCVCVCVYRAWFSCWTDPWVPLHCHHRRPVHV